MRYLILVYFLSILFVLSCQSRVKEATASEGNKDTLGVKAKEIGNSEEDIDELSEEYYRVDPADSAYHAFRTETATPPYGLEKIEILVKGIELVTDENYEGLRALNDSAYESLTFREKFTYHMIHAESYSQICDYIPPPKNSTTKIFSYLPEVFGEYSWSQKQRDFLNDNRDSVMALIKESVLRSKRMELNYKQTITEINGKEMIPFLIETYNNDKKDRDVLTLMMLLMRWNKYKPFVYSASYKKLYGAEDSYESYIDYNAASEELIIRQATDFYNGKE